MKIATLFYWAMRLVAAIIMFQTLYYKFSGSEESVYIFTTIGMEPWGRIAVGVMELIAAVLLLLSPTTWVGAGLAFGLMIGALGMHLTILGIEVKGDGGQLFLYALIVVVCSAVVLYYDREKVLSFTRRILGR